MARSSMTKREWVILATSVCAALMAVTLLRSPLDTLEDAFTPWKYGVRGPLRADTNIVVVYIDQEAVKSLQWPVRRNFYALMIRALTELHVKAIGLEPVFEDPKLEYPEYDNLLAQMIASAGNVVLTSYFDSVASPGAALGLDSLSGALFDYPAVLSDVTPATHAHLPLPLLRAAAAGIGHVNMTERTDIPLFLSNGRSRLPAFGLEMVRVYSGVRRDDLVDDGHRVTLRADHITVGFDLTSPERVSVNLPGSLRSFTAYPFLEVLRSYDALRGDRPPSIPIASLRGKIVLIGIIAEGRSAFLRTALDENTPALLLHAAVVDNILQNRFLAQSPAWLILLIALGAGIICGGTALVLRSRAAVTVLCGVPLLLVLVSFGLFAVGAVRFPIIPPVTVALVTGSTGLLIHQRRTRQQVAGLEREKQTILEKLRDREAKVALLEQELLTLETARSKNRTEELLDDLRKFKAEIRTLASQADDMDAYEMDHDRPGATVMEFEGIIYDGAGTMKPVVDFVSKIAGSDAPVLITGESGTGKELIARAIHRRSERRARAFVAVNCGALAESLLESELFGHEKGAFTGAVKDRIGRFELADGGTIFLDEIGEVSEAFQLKLLRVLQEGEFEKVGGSRTLHVDVRIVAATNRELKELVRAKKFREDLFYRLNVLNVVLPPLRDRTSDISLLIDHILQRDGGNIRVSRNVMDALVNYHWPGNIRELESALKRGVLMARADGRSMMIVKDLDEDVASAIKRAAPIGEQVLDLLREKGFSRSSVTDTAAELGGFNRGTVAEYLRGECLKAFAECTFDFERAVRRVSLSAESEVNDRVRRKLVDYLSNIAEGITPSQTWEANRVALRPKTKNLPQKYHLFLEQVAEACYRGVWKIP